MKCFGGTWAAPTGHLEGVARTCDGSRGTCFKFRSATEYDEQVVIDFPKISPIRGAVIRKLMEGDRLMEGPLVNQSKRVYTQ